MNPIDSAKRTTLKRLAYIPPAILTLRAVPSFAGTGSGQTEVAEPRIHGNNGVGNGLDPQPPGNPPINDGEGTGPGNPGARSR